MSSYFSKNEILSNNQINDSFLRNLLNSIQKIKNNLVDKIQLFCKLRWIITTVLIIIYFFRLWLTQGFQALTYCIGIYLLNSFIGFISPLNAPEDDPRYFDEGEIEVLDLNIKPPIISTPQNEEEFRPFERKVKEFEFWKISFFSFFIGIILTFFPMLDIPVYWPILLIYFILLFLFTMRQQIKRMVKFNYLPWDNGKTEYNPK